jgi:AcrR family transcriptional regulator
MTDESLVDKAKAQVEGLRERKRRVMRQLISDTATAMFLERGFNEVKVSEVAEACDVSEKTVYNYFPTKEALLLDQEEASAESIRKYLGPGATMSPVDGALTILEADLNTLYTHWVENPDVGIQFFKRFRDMVYETPSLRAASRDMNDRLARVAAESMAERAGLSPEDPEPQIASYAILGLWNVQWASIEKHSHDNSDPDQIRSQVTEDVKRAARLIDSGLWSFGSVLQNGNNREQMTAAAAAAQRAGKQVFQALKQAHAAWREVEREEDQQRKDRRDHQRDVRRQMNEHRNEMRNMQNDLRREGQKLREESKRQADEIKRLAKEEARRRR